MRVEKITSAASKELGDYLQTLEVHSNVDLSFESHLLELEAFDVTEDEILKGAFPEGWNKVEYRQKIDSDAMEYGIDKTISTYYEQELHSTETIQVGSQIWKLMEAIFPEGVTEIIELGWDVPYVNIYPGCTFLLKSAQQNRCLVVVINISD